MTLTITLPPPVQAALEADAKAQERPVAELAAERLAERYNLPVLKAVTETARAEDTSGAAVLAQWEKEGAFLPLEDLPEHQERARQIREQAQAPHFDSSGRRF